LFVMLDPSPVPLLTLVIMFTIILEQLSHCHWPLTILMSACVWVCPPPITIFLHCHWSLIFLQPALH
jgi:hypothetical protein